MSSRRDLDAVLQPHAATLTVRSTWVEACTATRSYKPPYVTDTQSLVPTKSETASLVQTDTRTRPRTRSRSFQPPVPSSALPAAARNTATAASMLTAASVLSGAGGPVALDTGRAVASLGAIARCASYEKSVEEAVQGGAALVEKIFVDSYLLSRPEFPESPLGPVCIGTRRGACIRGTVLANLVVIMCAIVVALVIGVLMKKHMAVEAATKRVDPRTSTLAGVTAAEAANDLADPLLMRDDRPKLRLASSRSTQSGARRQSLSPATTRDAAARTSSSSPKPPATRSSSSNGDGNGRARATAPASAPASPPARTTTAPAVRKPTKAEIAAAEAADENSFVAYSRLPLVIGQVCALLLAPWAQAAGVLIAAHDLPAGDAMIWGIVASLLLWICLYIALCRIVLLHVAHEPLDWRLEECFLNFGSSDPKFAPWRTKIGAFLRSPGGRWLFIGCQVWTEGASAGQIANGRVPTMLWQCGSVVNKFRTSCVIEQPIEQRTTPRRDLPLSRGQRRRALNNTVMSRAFVVDDWRSRVAPYYFFVSSALSAVTGFVVGVGIAAPRRCASVRIVLTVLSLLGVICTASVRPYLVPSRNVLAILADALLALGMVLSLVMDSADIASNIVTVAVAVSIFSGVMAVVCKVLMMLCRGALRVREQMWLELQASLVAVMSGLI